MPAEQNMSVVRAIYEAFGKGDVDAVLANVTDDVDWAADAASTAAPWYGPRKGKAGVAGFFSGLAGAIDVLEFSPLSIASTEDEVLAVLRFRLASKATGREAAMHLPLLAAARRQGRLLPRLRGHGPDPCGARELTA